MPAGAESVHFASKAGAALRVLSGLALVAACSSSDEGLFGGGTPDASAGSAGTSAGIGGSAGQSGSAGKAGAGGFDASAGSAGAPDAGGQAGDGQSGAGGTGGDAGKSGAAGAGGDPGIGTGPCNGPLCNFAAGQSCCVADGKGAACIAANQYCTCSGVLCNAVRIRCDGHEDCNGEICCAEFGFTSGELEGISCRQTCQSDFVQRREMCDPQGEPCKNGNACTPLTSLPPGYAACAP
jgi:hypothetical protein